MKIAQTTVSIVTHSGLGSTAIMQIKGVAPVAAGNRRHSFEIDFTGQSKTSDNQTIGWGRR